MATNLAIHTRVGHIDVDMQAIDIAIPLAIDMAIPSDQIRQEQLITA
jgi:hypothetical protein